MLLRSSNMEILRYDPIPWLMEQQGLSAIRARRLIGLDRVGDEKAVATVERRFARSQLRDGSFEHSPMKTATSRYIPTSRKTRGLGLRCSGKRITLETEFPVFFRYLVFSSIMRVAGRMAGGSYFPATFFQDLSWELGLLYRGLQQ